MYPELPQHESSLAHSLTFISFTFGRIFHVVYRDMSRHKESKCAQLTLSGGPAYDCRTGMTREAEG
jgi:hypothetical protein